VGILRRLAGERNDALYLAATMPLRDVAFEMGYAGVMGVNDYGDHGMVLKMFDAAIAATAPARQEALL
jgi:hypothetical protein